MLDKLRAPEIWIPVVSIFVLYIAAIAFRPLLPIDETRYMTVAWEMHLRGDWLAPLTVNFEPYHHKPPMLFWLINMVWSVFGVSRWAGALPVLISSIACVFLTRKLAEALFSNNQVVSRNVPMLMVGSVPFLIYSLMVMFDITLTVFVLSSLLALVAFAKSGEQKYLFLLALAMGLGVLTKGPVAWLYVIFPMLFGPLWIPSRMSRVKWYVGCFFALLLSTVPVLLWLIPMLSQASDNFATTLLWDQTAGRITGKFGNSHARSIWFYLPLLPVLFMPWMFFPSFWERVKGMRKNYFEHWAVRFLLILIVPVFIAFSFISGKQPHYLVPLLPGIIVLIAYFLDVPFKKLCFTTLGLVTALCIGQGIASYTVFKNYNLEPVVSYIRQNKDHDLAYIGNYHGEINFLARLEKPVDEESYRTLDDWFIQHHGGVAIICYEDFRQVSKYKMLLGIPYRGKNIGVFEAF